MHITNIKKYHFSIQKLTTLILVTIIFSISGPLPNPSFSQSPSIKSDSQKNDEPIEINADRMRSMNNGEKIIFSGNVVGVWGDLEIRSDVFELYTDNKKKKSNKDKQDGQSLKEVIAIGKVSIKKGKTRAKGDRATFYVEQDKVILIGSPKASAWEEGNKIEGKEMIFLLKEDRVVVNGRVEAKFFTNNKSPSKRKRRRK